MSLTFQIRRPDKSAYIYLKDVNGNTLYKLDSSKPKDVEFYDKTITFDVELESSGKAQKITIEVEKGVANVTGPQECTELSETAEWDVIFEGKFIISSGWEYTIHIGQLTEAQRFYFLTPRCRLLLAVGLDLLLSIQLT